jgi:hypothetical protein
MHVATKKAPLRRGFLLRVDHQIGRPIRGLSLGRYLAPRRRVNISMTMKPAATIAAFKIQHSAKSAAALRNSRKELIRPSGPTGLRSGVALQSERFEQRVNPTRSRANRRFSRHSVSRQRAGDFRRPTGLGKGKQPSAKGRGRPTFQAGHTCADTG